MMAPTWKPGVAYFDAVVMSFQRCPYDKMVKRNGGMVTSRLVPCMENGRMRYVIMSLRGGLSKLGCLIDASHQLNRRRLSLLSYSRHILIVALSAVLWWYPLTAKANSLPVVRIAILYDGPHSDFGVGEIFRKQLIQKEILSLTKGEFDVQFPSSVQFHGGWSLPKIRKALDALLKNPSVDMILTLGLLSSNEAVQLSEFSKPVIAPFIIDPDLQSISLKKRRDQVPCLTMGAWVSGLVRRSR